MSFVPIGAAEEEQGRTCSKWLRNLRGMTICKKNNPKPCEKDIAVVVVISAVSS
jgi:hypothetical protein